MSPIDPAAREGAATPLPVAWGSNPASFSRREIPSAAPRDFADLCDRLCSDGCRVSALMALPPSGSSSRGAQELLVVLADDLRSRLGLLRTEVPEGRGYPALSSTLPQAQAFERELLEDSGIVPLGHPWPKPLRRHAELEARAGEIHPAPPHTFFRVEGHGIHEVAVGPVHAGVIEPGHFRFQCHGEHVLHLEIQLGYQHRGARELFVRSSPARRLTITESIAGDTAVGHALAYCMAVETLADVEPPLGAQGARGLALELERLANHTGDLGALCNDVGYLPGASWFGRMRGEFLNLLMEHSGNRFGRGLLRPGGVRFALAPSRRAAFRQRLGRLDRDLRDTADLMFGAASVVTRFERTGFLSRAAAEDLGLVGPAARASGCDRDVRRDHPHGIHRFAYIPVAMGETGDVMARALVRWLETQRSMAFVKELLAEMGDERGPDGIPPLRPDAVSVALVEGWRGEIAHVAVTSAAGDIADYTFVDPSFHNWFGLAMAMRDTPISDFPLCNKSFNLSYAGHDL